MKKNLPKGVNPSPTVASPTSGQAKLFVRFGSHRARDRAFSYLARKPQGYFSWKRETDHGGTYQLTLDEAQILNTQSPRKLFTVLRAPYDDLMECWSI